MRETLANIVLAALGAGAAIVVKTVTEWYLNREFYHRVNIRRRKAFIGTWFGNGDDFYVQNGEASSPLVITLRLKSKWRRVRGQVEIVSKKKPHVNTLLECDGAFYNDDVAQLTYRSKDRSRKQMGVAVVNLSSDSNSLLVHYAGFSPTRNTFVAGKMNLKRERESILASSQALFEDEG
jgi:hypothetical protein